MNLTQQMLWNSLFVIADLLFINPSSSINIDLFLSQCFCRVYCFVTTDHFLSSILVNRRGSLRQYTVIFKALLLLLYPKHRSGISQRHLINRSLVSAFVCWAFSASVSWPRFINSDVIIAPIEDGFLRSKNVTGYLWVRSKWKASKLFWTHSVINVHCKSFQKEVLGTSTDTVWEKLLDGNGN